MRKAIFLTIALSLISMSFIGCGNISASEITNSTAPTTVTTLVSTSTAQSTSQTTPATTTAPYTFPGPFPGVDEGITLSEKKLQAIISNVPSDKYESFKGLHGAPLTATLYKDGEVTSLDVNDPRIIRLMNLYNNAVYNSQYSYTQGLLSIDYMSKVTSEEFRLELTFTPSSGYAYYDTNILRYSTFIITNSQFFLINYDMPGYEGEEDRYPYLARGHSPLHDHYAWLDLLGF